MAVYDSWDLLIYWDGTQENTTSKSGLMATNDEDMTIGRRGDATEAFDGIIDEVRVSNVARSADWIAAQHLSMSDTFFIWKQISQWAEVDPYGP